MKKTLGWILFLSLYWNGFSQKDVVGYLKKFAPIAVREMERSGIPASIKLGQGILESSYGHSPLAQIANNHFGIKCGKNWSGAVFHYDDDRRGECFRKYDTPWHSFLDHSKFLKKSRYAKLFSLSRDDYKAWARVLKKAGYATAKDYAERLIAQIETYRLWRFDREQAQGLENRIDHLLVNMGLTKSDNDMVANSYHKSNKFNPYSDKTVNLTPPQGLQNHLSSQERIRYHENDGLKYIIVREKETLRQISETYSISIERLMRYNDLSFDRFLLPGQCLFLEKKNHSGVIRFYKVIEGEDMYIISQKTGIRLEELYYHNRMEPGEQTRPGDILYLQGRKEKT
ncbi:MAG: glucosaminidase domain-containing protein [Flavobacteriales bacterium AspAUS03]